MKAYCKETEKPLMDNKPDTPTDEQVLGDLFGDCHVYLFATQTKENSTGASPGRSLASSSQENNLNIIQGTK